MCLIWLIEGASIYISILISAPIANESLVETKSKANLIPPATREARINIIVKGKISFSDDAISK